MLKNFGIGTLAAASVQIAAHGIDDPILHRRFKISMHRQTEYLVGQPVAQCGPQVSVMPFGWRCSGFE